MVYYCWFQFVLFCFHKYVTIKKHFISIEIKYPCFSLSYSNELLGIVWIQLILSIYLFIYNNKVWFEKFEIENLFFHTWRTKSGKKISCCWIVVYFYFYLFIFLFYFCSNNFSSFYMQTSYYYMECRYSEIYYRERL